MSRKFNHLLPVCIVLVMVAAASCEKENPVTPSLENGFNAGFGYVGGYTSRNAAFEKDWSSQTKIKLVTEYYEINDEPVVKTIDVPLPWAWEDGPKQWLPRYTARYMAELYRKDWTLVFNLTGIDEKPGEHYFGLYNRYTGVLRVFYYLTEDRIPAHDANDHMWAMGLSKDLVEHIIFQFAIPYEEEATEAYKKLLGGNDALFQTTALTAECSDAGKVVPKVGWWAYDIDMSSLRKHDFFESNYSMMRPGMNVFHEDNVVLSSILEGSLDGTFSGNMNLNSLKGAGTTTAGLICGVLGTFGNGMFTQMKVLDCWFGTVTKGPALTAILGLALGAIGKGLEGGLKKASQDPDKLGEFSGKINLSLNARIETAGSISGERTTLVPSPELNVASFIKNEGGLGRGVWNVDHYPVVYVVKDAYWGDKPKFSSVEKTTSEGRTAYQLTVDPDNFGLRLISFLDPTSIGGVHINPDAIPEDLNGNIEIRTSYGVLNYAQPGYTDATRKALGIDYTVPDLSSKSSFQSDDPGVGFRVIKKPHADNIFLTEIPDDEKEFIGHRLSQQQLTSKIHRRMFGASAFFSNPSAGTDQLDDVTMVTDPEVYLPVNSTDRLLFNMDIPDYVVTAVMTLEAGEDETMMHSLRILPKIEFISILDIPAVYSQIVSRAAKMPAGNITYPQMEQDLEKIRKIKDNAK